VLDWNLRTYSEISNSVMLYDVACKMKNYLSESSLKNFIQEMKYAVSIFHSFAHIPSCQVQFSPRRVEGCGLADGEAMERVWSYLNKYVRSTRYMQPSHRIDTLSYALYRFATKIVDDIGKYIKNC